MKTGTLLVISCGIVFGSIYGYMQESAYALFLFLLFGLSCLFLYFFVRQKIFVLSALFCLCVVATGLRTHFVVHDSSDFVLNNFVDQSVTLVGTVEDFPDARDNGIDVSILPTSIDGQHVDEEALVLVRIPYTDVSYGDTITVSGRLSVPEDFETDTGRIFDYDKYLAHRDIYFVFRSNTVIVEEGEDNSIKSKLFSIKTYVLGLIHKIMDEPESSLLAGLILGVRQTLSPEFREALINTGTIHIIALSGYNIALIAGVILKMFSFFSRRIQIVCSIVSVGLFAVMTGGGATVVRAALMGSLALIARMFGRTALAGRILLLTLCAMTLYDPRTLLFDVSFHLSFLATLGILYVAPLVELRMKFIPDKFEIRNIVTSTLGTQLAVLPYIVFAMGTFSFVSPVVNILILPFVPLAMIVGFGALIVAFVIPTLGFVVGLAVSIPLEIIEIIVFFFDSLPFGLIVVPDFSWVIVCGVYIFFAYKVYRMTMKNSNVLLG